MRPFIQIRPCQNLQETSCAFNFLLTKTGGGRGVKAQGNVCRRTESAL